MGIVSLVMGILGIVFCLIPVFGFCIALVALIIAIVAMIRKKNYEKYRGLKIAGLVLSIVAMLVSTFMSVIPLVFLF